MYDPTSHLGLISRAVRNFERDGKPAKKKKGKDGKDDAPPAMKIVGTEESDARSDLPPF